MVRLLNGSMRGVQIVGMGYRPLKRNWCDSWTPGRIILFVVKALEIAEYQTYFTVRTVSGFG